MARKAWNHRKCAEHRKVEGYTAKVCVLPGQDGDEVEHFATVLYKVAAAFRRRILKPAVRRRQFDLHDVCGGHFPFPGMGKVCYGTKRMSDSELEYAEHEARVFAKEIGHLRAENPRYARFYTGDFWR
jgi:hypothetical protein